MPTPLRRIGSNIQTCFLSIIQYVIANASSSNPPEYRRVIEAALRSHETAAAEEALAAYRDDPLLLIHSAHYPVIYRALQAYQQREPSSNVATVIEQIEHVMTGGRRAI